MMDRTEAAKIVAILTATWPNHPVPNPQALLMAWQLGLDGVDADDAMGAVSTWIQTGKFFPAVSEIRSLCGTTERLDSETYGRYAELRRLFQAGDWDAALEREMSQVETRLGIRHLESRRSTPVRLLQVVS